MEKIKSITLNCKLEDNGAWSVYCPELRCERVVRNLTREAAAIAAQVEIHNQEIDNERARLETLEQESEDELDRIAAINNFCKTI